MMQTIVGTVSIINNDNYVNIVDIKGLGHDLT